MTWLPWMSLLLPARQARTVVGVSACLAISVPGKHRREIVFELPQAVEHAGDQRGPGPTANGRIYCESQRPGQLLPGVPSCRCRLAVRRIQRVPGDQVSAAERVVPGAGPHVVEEPDPVRVPCRAAPEVAQVVQRSGVAGDPAGRSRPDQTSHLRRPDQPGVLVVGRQRYGEAEYV